LLDFILYILFILFILFAGTRFKVEAENSRSDKHQSIKTLCSTAANLERLIGESEWGADECLSSAAVLMKGHLPTQNQQPNLTSVPTCLLLTYTHKHTHTFTPLSRSREDNARTLGKRAFEARLTGGSKQRLFFRYLETLTQDRQETHIRGNESK